MLVPHEPRWDPRIAWSASLCDELADTTVVAATTDESAVGVDSAAVRAHYYRDSSPVAHAFFRAYHLRRAGRAGAALADWGFYGLLISALRRRAATAPRPDVIVCHDLFALIAGAPLARRFGSRMLYDTHEFFPYAKPSAPRWETQALKLVEGHFVRDADAVVTVSPPLARELERVYGLGHVVVAPNAAPLGAAPLEFPEPASELVTFLVQGQIAPGRGFGRLLRAWTTVDVPGAVLQIRAPENAYATALRTKFSALFDEGRAQWLPAVAEDELIAAAASAHVGVIPYPGPLPNHVLSCPNKLSQYMAAGMAILSSRDLLYVRELVDRYDMGLVYDPLDAASLRAAVRRFVVDERFRRAARSNARSAFEASFNWDRCSAGYRQALARLLDAP